MSGGGSAPVVVIGGAKGDLAEDMGPGSAPSPSSPPVVACECPEVPPCPAPSLKSECWFQRSELICEASQLYAQSACECEPLSIADACRLACYSREFSLACLAPQEGCHVVCQHTLAICLDGCE